MAQTGVRVVDELKTLESRTAKLCCCCFWGVQSLYEGLSF